MLTYNLDFVQIVFESAFEKGQNRLFLVDCFTVSLNLSLLSSQFLDSVGYLVSHSGKTFSNLLIPLQYLYIICNRFKKMLSKSLNLFSVNNVLLKEFFWKLD